MLKNMILKTYLLGMCRTYWKSMTNLTLGPQETGKYMACKSHEVSEYFHKRFWLETASMPPEPKMGLGEVVKISGQWRVAAVPFGCFFGV